MGVTIHFEGTVRDLAAVEKVRDAAVEFAVREGWLYHFLNDSISGDQTEKLADELPIPPPLVLQPFPLCEPMLFEFDQKLRTQGWVKTQFAHHSVHVKIVELLRSVEEYFESLTVADEGELWQTGDEAVLREHFSVCARRIESEKTNDPNLIGPVCLRDGRILDLVGVDLVGALLQAADESSPSANSSQSRLDGWIRSITFGESPIEDVDFDEPTSTWFTSVTIENEEGTEQVFELEFQYIDAPEYLIIRWIVVPPDELPDDCLEDVKFVNLILELNEEVGAKWCISTDVSGQNSLVCEVELPVQSLTKAMLVTSLDHSIDIVGTHWDYIESMLSS